MLLALFVDFYGHIRADPAARRAARALIRIVEDHKMITLIVKFLREPEGVLRAGDNTKLAALAPFFIDDNLSHDSIPYPITYGTQINADFQDLKYKMRKAEEAKYFNLCLSAAICVPKK